MKHTRTSKVLNRPVLVKLVLPVLGSVLAVALIAQAGGWRKSLSSATPQARTAAAAETPETARVVAEGRLASYPGASAEVGTEVKGMVARVLVQEKETVRKGQLLAELRNDDLQAGLAQARARVGEAVADSRLYESEFTRTESLIAQSVESQSGLDNARRNRDAAVARQAVAEAEVARLEAELAKTRIASPIDGIVLGRAVEPGETVDAGMPLFSVADLRRVRVEAEIDEFDAGHLETGAPVVLTAEGYEGRTWNGIVEEIPDQVVPRRLKPEDPGRSGDTRVLLVKIAVADPSPLKLGQRVEVVIEEGGR